eukprot:UN28487
MIAINICSTSGCTGTHLCYENMRKYEILMKLLTSRASKKFSKSRKITY